MHEDTPVSPEHLTKVAQIRSLTDPAATWALDKTDRYWLTRAQRTVMNRWRFEGWIARHPDYYVRHVQFEWWQWTTENEGEEIIAGSMSLARRKQIAKAIHEAMGKPDAPTTLDIAYEMAPLYAKWWREIGCDAAQNYGDHADERHHRRVLEERFEKHIATHESDRERHDAFAAFGVDMISIAPLWTDELPVEITPPQSPQERFACTDAEWAQLSGFFPPRGKSGRAIDWRRMVDTVMLIHNTNTSWAQVPYGSTIRMQFYKSIDAGVWSKIAAALPTLNTGRRHHFEKVIQGAHRWAQRQR